MTYRWQPGTVQYCACCRVDDTNDAPTGAISVGWVSHEAILTHECLYLHPAIFIVQLPLDNLATWNNAGVKRRWPLAGHHDYRSAHASLTSIALPKTIMVATMPMALSGCASPWLEEPLLSLRKSEGNGGL